MARRERMAWPLQMRKFEEVKEETIMIERSVIHLHNIVRI